MAVLCTDQQQDDMVRFLTNPLNYVIMGVDPAFNFGDIYVTPIVYQHLLLEHRSRKNHPIMLGAILVHHDKKFSSYHYFASTLISLKPSLRNIIAFGTDGEEELFEAFQTQLPNTLHLRCFCHFRSIIKRKLLDLFTFSVIDAYLGDIFKNTVDGVHTEGLVHAVDFLSRLQSLEEVQMIECATSDATSATLYKWFLCYKAEAVTDSMLRPIREAAAGLGIPPFSYYTNNSESMNSVMHTKTHYKASEWDQFNKSMHELVQQSNKLVEMSVIGRGSYCFCS